MHNFQANDNLTTNTGMETGNDKQNFSKKSTNFGQSSFDAFSPSFNVIYLQPGRKESRFGSVHRSQQ